MHCKIIVIKIIIIKRGEKVGRLLCLHYQPSSLRHLERSRECQTVERTKERHVEVGQNYITTQINFVDFVWRWSKFNLIANYSTYRSNTISDQISLELGPMMCMKDVCLALECYYKF